MTSPNAPPPAAVLALSLAVAVCQPLGTAASAQAPPATFTAVVDTAAAPGEGAGAQPLAATAPTAADAPAAAPALGPVVPVPAGLTRPIAAADTGRPRAVTYSDAYGTRLAIHRYASYATLPVFAAEYVLGNKLIHYRDVGQPSPQGTKSAHAAVAAGLGALFAVNTVTGVWNWWDARHDPNGRARRTVHSALMLAADAGFAAAGALAGRAGNDRSGAHIHRNVALASMGVTIGAGALMYLWKQ